MFVKAEKSSKLEVAERGGGGEGSRGEYICVVIIIESALSIWPLLLSCLPKLK